MTRSTLMDITLRNSKQKSCGGCGVMILFMAILSYLESTFFWRFLMAVFLLVIIVARHTVPITTTISITTSAERRPMTRFNGTTPLGVVAAATDNNKINVNYWKIYIICYLYFES